MVGRQHIVLRLLERRFGAISDITQRRIAALSASELDDVADRLLDPVSIGDLLLEAVATARPG